MNDHLTATPLQVTDLTCEVPGRMLFSSFSLEIAAGESVAVVGPSGTGKSTLLSTVLGLRRPAHGTVNVCGHDVYGGPRRELVELRRREIGIVFQDGELLVELTAAENVAVAAMLSLPDPRDAMTTAHEVLAAMGVPPDTGAGDLSGGERQRTALARALVNSPSLVLADEPTGSLDARTRDEVADVLFAVPHERRCGLLIVTHDPTIADRADRVVELAAMMSVGSGTGPTSGRPG